MIAGPLIALLLQAATPQAGAAPVELPSDDIVVTGLRDIDDPESPVTRGTVGSSKVGNATLSRQTFAAAERFARCAVKRTPRGGDELRATLDSTTNSARQVFMQARFVARNLSCAEDTATGTAAIPRGAHDPSYYVRGAMVMQAMKVFAPDLRLTKAQTADLAVQARFNARETTLARFRLPADRTYFETAICLVRLQPELAVRLMRVTDYPSVGRVEAAMVNGARECTGHAEKVYFDPTQFRFYIADALYRWLVAARGVDTLIPGDRPAND